MSSLAQPTIAPKTRVIAPTMTTQSCALGAWSKIEAAAHHEVDAGGDHRRGVDQRGDGCRAGHGVAEPALQRELRRLAAGTEQEHQADRRQDAFARATLGGLLDTGEGHRAECREHDHDADRQAEVTDPVDDERLVGGGGVGRVVVPEADQQVGRETHALPADVEEQVGVGQHQQEHRRDEQVEVGEEPALVRVVLHVPDRVDVDERPHEGHQQHEGHGQLVDEHAGVEVERAGRHPVEQVQVRGAVLAVAAEHGQPDDEADDEGRPRQRGGEQRPPLVGARGRRAAARRHRAAAGLPAARRMP